MAEVKLQPGWLTRDTNRAAERVKVWEHERTEAKKEALRSDSRSEVEKIPNSPKSR